MTKNQKDVWISYPQVEINVDNQASQDNIPSRIKNHFYIWINKIDELNKTCNLSFENNFEKPWRFIEYVNQVIKKESKKIKKIGWEAGENIYRDLMLQVSSIEGLLRDKSTKVIKKLTIEKEYDPLKIMMMWNWVTGSCLDYYNNIWNYWSSISNTIDINKGVFYLKDENRIIIWRVLVAIDNNGKLVRFPMYYNGNISIDLDMYFNEYLKKLAKIWWFWLNGDAKKVENIESEEWYIDPVTPIPLTWKERFCIAREELVSEVQDILKREENNKGDMYMWNHMMRIQIIFFMKCLYCMKEKNNPFIKNNPYAAKDILQKYSFLKPFVLQYFEELDSIDDAYFDSISWEDDTVSCFEKKLSQDISLKWESAKRRMLSINRSKW